MKIPSLKVSTLLLGMSLISAPTQAASFDSLLGESLVDSLKKSCEATARNYEKSYSELKQNRDDYLDRNEKLKSQKADVDLRSDMADFRVKAKEIAEKISPTTKVIVEEFKKTKEKIDASSVSSDVKASLKNQLSKIVARKLSASLSKDLKTKIEFDEYGYNGFLPISSSSDGKTYLIQINPNYTTGPSPLPGSNDLLTILFKAKYQYGKGQALDVDLRYNPSENRYYGLAEGPLGDELAKVVREYDGSASKALKQTNPNAFSSLWSISDGVVEHYETNKGMLARAQEMRAQCAQLKKI